LSLKELKAAMAEAEGAATTLKTAEAAKGQPVRRKKLPSHFEHIALVRQASSPKLLRDFGRWQDVAWRRDTLALH
jgi:hypothetical protein